MKDTSKKEVKRKNSLESQILGDKIEVVGQELQLDELPERQASAHIVRHGLNFLPGLHKGVALMM